MADYTVICKFRPEKKQLKKVTLEIKSGFNGVSKPQIDRVLEKEHSKFFNVAHGRYQWEIKL